VINRSGLERYSIPLFFGTDYDVPLEVSMIFEEFVNDLIFESKKNYFFKPIPTCVSLELPSKYEVITAGEYVKSRLEATYASAAVT
jgi:hypothetical protein